MQFHKGQSGNPAGKLPGTRNRRTLLAEQWLNAQTETILEKLGQLVEKGDPIATRFCMDRISPRLRERPITFALPALATPADAAAAMAEINRGLADGELSASEAADLARAVEAFVVSLTAADFEARLTRLETLAKERATDDWEDEP